MLKIATTLAPVVTPAELFEQWTQAKSDELAATQRRREVEELIAAAIPLDKQEGQKTMKFGPWRVLRVNEINYRGDIQKILELSKELEIEPPVRYTLSASACKKLKKLDPTSFGLLVEEEALSFSDAKPKFDISLVPEPSC